MVVSEGAYPKNGDKIVQATAEETHGLVRLGGIGHYVAQQIADREGLETRVVVLGHVQRGGTPSPFDRILASRFGVQAVEMLAQGQYGQMVALRGREMVAVPIDEAVAEQNLIDPAGNLAWTAEQLGIMLGR